MLKETGCGLAQGYHFSRPLDREQATRFIRENSASYSPFL